MKREVRSAKVEVGSTSKLQTSTFELPFAVRILQRKPVRLQPELSRTTLEYCVHIASLARISNVGFTSMRAAGDCTRARLASRTRALVASARTVVRPLITPTALSVSVHRYRCRLTELADAWSMAVCTSTHA